VSGAMRANGVKIGMMAGIMMAFMTTTAVAQRGTGEEEGLARRGLQPEMEEISGRLTAIETGPCQRTTGQEYIGTHLMIRTDDGRDLNVHIGAASAVQSFVDPLKVGQQIEATVFRTDRLPPDHYVAKTLRSGDAVLDVRREDLSPFWARQRWEMRRDRDNRREQPYRRMERNRE